MEFLKFSSLLILGYELCMVGDFSESKTTISVGDVFAKIVNSQ